MKSEAQSSIEKREKNGEKLSQADARKLRDELLSVVREIERRVVEAAIKLDQFIRGRGWESLGYKTLNDWRNAEFNQREYYNLRAVRLLLNAGVPPENVQKMKLTNINVMVRQLPKSAWMDPEWQKAAAEMPVIKFEQRAKNAGKTIAVEDMVRRGFVISLSLANKWDQALEVAEMVDGAATMEERIEAIVSTYLDAPSEVPGKSKLQAYLDVLDISPESASGAEAEAEA